MDPNGQILQINLRRADNSTSWGFRMEGGADMPRPLNIQKVNPGSLAEHSGLQDGDLVVRINNCEAAGMRHDEAKMEIIRSGDDVTIFVQRGGMQTVWAPQVVTASELPPDQQQMLELGGHQVPMATKTSLAANRQEFHNIGSTHNAVPQPFGFQAPAAVVTQTADGRTKKVVHSQFNSPLGLYSDHNVDNVFREKVTESQSESGAAMYHPVQAPAPGTPSTLSQPQSMYCGACGDLIKGVFVKIQGKIAMHPTCLKCVKCGVGLRNVGYFFINDQLYCETHARQVSKPPGPDMQPMVVYK